MPMNTRQRNVNALRLNGNQLKLIAVISMLLDHFGFLLVGKGCMVPLMNAGEPYGGWWIFYNVLRMAGRVAFPVFCFLLVEGFLHTKNWKKYVLRLGIFAAVSEVPFDLVDAGTLIGPAMQNVFFTLLIGFLMMKVLETAGGWLSPEPDGPHGAGAGHGLGAASRTELTLLLQLVVIVLFCGAAWILKTDYDYIGIMLIALFYWFRCDRQKLCVFGFVWMSVMMRKLLYLPGFALAFMLIYFYTGERGKWKGKYFFYLFYPVHLLILTWIYNLVFM